MGLLYKLLGDDQQRAATKYAGRESASAAAHRRRVNGHRNGGAQRAAGDGQAWEDRDRQNDRRGGWRLTDWSK